MRLAITGFGVVSSLGVGRAAWEAAVAEGDLRAKSLGRATAAPGDLPVAEVWDWEPKVHLGPKGHRSLDRLTKFLVTAGKYALEDAGLKAEGAFLAEETVGPTDVGVCSATAYGSLDAITELNRVAELEDPRYINPQRFPNTVINAAAGYVSIWEDLRAPNTTIVDGNCGALDAVVVAETHLQHGRAKAMLVGGGEVATEPLVRALCRLGLATGDGITGDGTPLAIGEGATYFVVEQADAANARGATTLAELRGYGTAFDAPASEAQLVHGSSAALYAAITGALGEANLDADAIDLVISTQSGLAFFDDAEKAALAEAAIDAPLRTPKRHLGETFGAAGAFGMLDALDSFRSGTAQTALVLTLGYYGNASAVVMQRPAKAPTPTA